MMARKTMGRWRDRGGRPEERGRGPGRRPRARAAAWSRSLNGCDGKEDTLAPAWTTLSNASPKRTLCVDFMCPDPLSEFWDKHHLRGGRWVLSSYVSFAHFYYLSAA